ncbi:aldo/keto reductase [Thermodesulfobacteriota bacterium]
MEKLRLGRTGLMTSRIGFGGIPIQRLTEDESIDVVRKCLDLGVNFIDTANAYTTSEERIGKAIAERREGLIIATKTHARTPEVVEKDIRLSLERLRTETIDLYQFHNVSTVKDFETVIDPNGPISAVEKAVKDGQIKHIGVTSHSMDVAKELVKSDRFATIMFPFNFIVKEAETDLLPLAKEHDVGVIAMKPLAGGMLDNAVIAFKYLLQFPAVLPIPGIEKPHEIEEIIRICEGPKTKMSVAEEDEMQRLREELGTKFCRRCNYCQPCTEGIPISTVMIIESFAKRFPPQRFFAGNPAAAMEKATLCTECGECEDRCPYKLPIREMMAERVTWYQKNKEKYEASVAS